MRNIIQTLVLSLLCTPSFAAPITFEATGADAAAVESVMAAFRAAVAGTGGGTEITWDDVPDSLADPNPLPGDFYAAQGLQFATPGTGFLVSADDSNPTSTRIAFGFTADYRPYSGQRVFSPVNSTTANFTFVQPGTATPATVAGFGAVFSDVEFPNQSFLRAFDGAGNEIFSRAVLSTFSGGLSFLGVYFDDAAPIARVQLQIGTTVLVRNSQYIPFPLTDAVALDNVIYSTPQAVPAPPALALFATGLLALAARVRRRNI
jgi:hypothetical protein